MKISIQACMYSYKMIKLVQRFTGFTHDVKKTLETVRGNFRSLLCMKTAKVF